MLILLLIVAGNHILHNCNIKLPNCQQKLHLKISHGRDLIDDDMIDGNGVRRLIPYGISRTIVYNYLLSFITVRDHPNG